MNLMKPAPRCDRRLGVRHGDAGDETAIAGKVAYAPAAPSRCPSGCGSSFGAHACRINRLNRLIPA